jgi:hypothetical protein
MQFHDGVPLADFSTLAHSTTRNMQRLLSWLHLLPSVQPAHWSLLPRSSTMEDTRIKAELSSSLCPRNVCACLSSRIPHLSVCTTNMNTNRFTVIGYGMAGMMRRTLLWPTKMLYPENLPISTVLETLHRDKAGNRKRMKVFWIIFTTLLVWEIVPEVRHPLCTSLAGV